MDDGFGHLITTVNQCAIKRLCNYQAGPTRSILCIYFTEAINTSYLTTSTFTQFHQGHH